VRSLAVAGAAVLVAVAAGCAGDDAPPEGDAAGGGGATATTAAPTTTADPEGIGDLEALAPELLVTAADLGAGTEDLGYAPAPPPALCELDLDAQHPVAVHAGTTLRQGAYVLTQVVRVLDGEPAAAAAFDAWVAAEPSCRPANPPVTGPQDVNDRVGADRAVLFRVTTRGGEAVLVVALVGDALVSFDHSVPTGGPDPVDVAAFGVGKILAALEA
jgi:hypothetical protein